MSTKLQFISWPSPFLRDFGSEGTWSGVGVGGDLEGFGFIVLLCLVESWPGLLGPAGDPLYFGKSEKWSSFMPPAIYLHFSPGREGGRTQWLGPLSSTTGFPIIARGCKQYQPFSWPSQPIGREEGGGGGCIRHGGMDEGGSGTKYKEQ